MFPREPRRELPLQAATPLGRWQSETSTFHRAASTTPLPRGAHVAQMVKSLPAVRETWVRPLCREDPLEKEMATHSSILAWKIPWREVPGRLQSMGSQRVGHN